MSEAFEKHVRKELKELWEAVDKITTTPPADIGDVDATDPEAVIELTRYVTNRFAMFDERLMKIDKQLEDMHYHLMKIETKNTNTDKWINSAETELEGNDKRLDVLERKMGIYIDLSEKLNTAHEVIEMLKQDLEDAKNTAESNTQINDAQYWKENYLIEKDRTKYWRDRAEEYKERYFKEIKCQTD
jgi:hypothetical protein